MVWLDRPLRDQPVPSPTPSAPYLFCGYTGDEAPVPVTRPFLTRGAARSMPVQAWLDPWHSGVERVLRHHADCATCTRSVWRFDDGQNDPRGVLGVSSAAWSLDPREYDQPSGEPVALCAECGSDSAPTDAPSASSVECGPTLVPDRAPAAHRRARHPARGPAR